MSQYQELARRPRPMPAWLASMGMHVLLLILLSFVVVGAARTDQDDEPVRPAGIVLAKKTDDQKREYFEETVETDPTEQTDATTESNSSPDVATAQQSPADSFVISDLALPSAADVAVPGVSLVDTPRLTVGGRRPKLPGVDESEIVAEAQEAFRAANARGPMTKLGIFGGKEAVGGSFVFLIDRSKSMGSSGLGVLQAAEKELSDAVRRLEPVHHFQVVVYHAKCIYMNDRSLLPATDENKAGVADFIATKAAFGRTEHLLALMSVLTLEPDVIFLITDGGEPPLKDHEIRSIAKLTGKKTSIHCLHFGSTPTPEPNNFLRRLAAATGGEYGYVNVNK